MSGKFILLQSTFFSNIEEVLSNEERKKQQAARTTHRAEGHRGPGLLMNYFINKVPHVFYIKFKAQIINKQANKYNL